MADTNKVVAAILAAAKVSKMGEKPAADYLEEYEGFLSALQKRDEDRAAAADQALDNLAKDRRDATRS